MNYSSAELKFGGLDVEEGRLNVEPQRKPRYTLEELLAASDYLQPQPPEEREWVDASARRRADMRRRV